MSDQNPNNNFHVSRPADYDHCMKIVSKIRELGGNNRRLLNAEMEIIAWMIETGVLVRRDNDAPDKT
jgi:hypothetical protein